MESKEQNKPSGAKKKCLYNFQDAFLESSGRVVMATSGSTASVSCTATTVQSNDVFHSLGKDNHRQPPPAAPRNSPTGLASLPPLSGPALLPPALPSTHLPAMSSQPFPKMAATSAPAPGFLEAHHHHHHHHQGVCLSPAEPPASSGEGPVSAPPSVCSDPDCEGHRCEGNGAYEHQPYDGDESPDEDSCSEHSSSTSTSTNQKEGKYCDCCYCEFFGHGGPPAAPTSRNYAEMREKLRLRLTKRKEEQQPRRRGEEQQQAQGAAPERDGGGGGGGGAGGSGAGVEDHRRVEDLLQFINSADSSKPTSSSKAAKRARHKQKKREGPTAKAKAEGPAEEESPFASREETALWRRGAREHLLHNGNVQRLYPGEGAAPCAAALAAAVSSSRQPPSPASARHPGQQPQDKTRDAPAQQPVSVTGVLRGRKGTRAQRESARRRRCVPTTGTARSADTSKTETNGPSRHRSACRRPPTDQSKKRKHQKTEAAAAHHQTQPIGAGPAERQAPAQRRGPPSRKSKVKEEQEEKWGPWIEQLHRWVEPFCRSPRRAPRTTQTNRMDSRLKHLTDREEK
ncbi:hypothetical protein CRUP_010119, partial [Coryphaenoides rupestris]